MNEDNKIDFKKNLKLYLDLTKPFKWYFIAIMFLVLIVSVTGLIHKFVFKELIDNATIFSTGTTSLEIFINTLIILLIIFVASSIIQTISQWIRLYLINMMEGKLLLNLKKKYYYHIIDLSHGFHTNNKTGSLISRLTRGSKALERITDILVFNIFFLITEFIVAFISLALIDFTSAIILIIMAVCFTAFSLYISIKGEKYNVAMNYTEDSEKAFIGDTITNIETIKYFGKENNIKDNYFKLGDITRKNQVKFWNYSNWIASGHGVIIDLFTIIIMSLAILRLINGNITIGTVAFIYTIYLGISYVLSDFTWRIRDLYSGITDFDSITKYGDIQNNVKDENLAKPIIIKKGEIVFENVYFDYQKRKILKNFNLHIKPNQKIALVGHSGSGKTTIIKLLYRFYDLKKGTIKIDNQDISQIKQLTLRNEMSIVPQEGILFNDTIYNNILFSNPTSTRKEVIKAMKSAQFYDFIQTLPLKENTMVGERGIKLSGGEKQRLSIARALLANKKILILDEATSALDSNTENEIQKALWQLMKGRTTIIVAHRLSTIMHADKIVVMNKGKMVQQGNHSDLVNQKGLYQDLWNLQKGTNSKN